VKRSPHKSGFREGRWGLSFKDGKLYEFTDSHVVVIKGWPDPRAWLKCRSHGWRPTRKWADALFSQPLFLEKTPPPENPTRPFVLPGGQMILPGVLITAEYRMRKAYWDHLARTAFIALIPDEIRLELQRYWDRRWHLMNIFARCPGALDLSRSNPALLFALASNWVFHKPAVTQPMRAARSLVWKKQKAIQEWLGFPGTEPVRRLLAKITPEAVNVEGLLYLREALRNPSCLELLRHLPKLNRAALMLAVDRRTMEHVTPKLLEDTLENPTAKTIGGEFDGRQDIYKLMLHTVRMAWLVDWEKCPKTFCSVKSVATVHDELASRLDAIRLKKKYNIPDRFIDPPFPGTEHIIPLTTPEELIREGYLQKNCVGTYVFEVIHGWEYVYRVEQPVRATLAVANKWGSWVQHGIFKACNQPIEARVRRDVFRALSRSRLTQPANRNWGIGGNWGHVSTIDSAEKVGGSGCPPGRRSAPRST